MTTGTAANLQGHIVEGKFVRNEPEEKTGELLKPALKLTRTLSR